MKGGLPLGSGGASAQIVAASGNTRVCSEGLCLPSNTWQGTRLWERLVVSFRIPGELAAAWSNLLDSMAFMVARGVERGLVSSPVTIGEQKNGEYEQMMEHYEPIMSFGEDTAEIYDTEPDVSQRGGTLATVSFLRATCGRGFRAGACHRHRASRAAPRCSRRSRRRHRLFTLYSRQAASQAQRRPDFGDDWQLRRCPSPGYLSLDLCGVQHAV